LDPGKGAWGRGCVCGGGGGERSGIKSKKRGAGVLIIYTTATNNCTCVSFAILCPRPLPLPTRYFGDPIAIKIQKLPKNVSISKGTFSTYLLRELSVLKNARHENLLEYIGACETAEVNEEDPATLYIVTEFAANGDLLHLLSSDAPLGWNFLTRIILGAMDGLHYLHDKGIIHRDIKSENILLDGNWCPKVSDFGMAREVGGGAAREGDQRAKHQFR